jgi:uncharacterized membrane protein YgcG
MKNLINVLCLLAISLFSINSFAFNPPDAPPNGTYVLDLANKLSIDQIHSLNNKIENINRSTKNEFGVLLLSSLDGDSIDDAAYSTFNHWGIGKKNLDNGVLLVISFSERKTRIETGKGVGELTDLQSNDILQNTLRPQLKAGNVYQGINDTIDKCSALIESRANEKAANTSTSSSDNESWVWWILGFIGLGGVIALVYNYFSSKKEEQEEIARENNDLQDLKRLRSVYNTSNIKPNLNATTPDLPKHHVAETVAVVGAVAVAATVIEEERLERKRREREEESNRRREEESRSSSYESDSSSSSSSDYSSSSSDSGFDGGSSGGGGSDGSF